MQLRDDKLIDVGTAMETCPSCESDDWKSARMIVLEGTSFAEGQISGDCKDPGRLSGSLKAFLLSDRWFSWDYKLDGDIVLTTKSGLVEVVKRFMVDQSSMIPMPSIPIEPKKIGFFARIRPVEPRMPIEPNIPEKPQDKPWYSHFRSKYFMQIWIVIMSCIGFEIPLYLMSSKLVLIKSILFLIGFTVINSLIRSLNGNKIARNKYEKRMIKYQKELNNYKFNAEKYHLEYQKYLNQIEEAKLQQNKYDQAAANYNDELSIYESKKNKVMKKREMLWEKARVCTRCGTVYMGINA